MSELASGAYIQFGPDHMPEVSASVRLRASSLMYCHTYPDMAPVISISDAPVKVAISVPDPERVTGRDVQCARQLSDLVARYVAELEQLAAAQRDPGSGRDAPAGQAA
jgi:hypothetical protein